MFTGIVEELGRVVRVADLGDAARITVAGPLVVSDAGIGDSIAVNGVCLTVTALGQGEFTADVMAETLNRTTLGSLQPGAPVNLERPLTATSRLGGHIVQGHVDAVGAVAARESSEHWDVVTVSAPAEVLRYVVEKGSVTVDGTSLTVAAVDGSSFQVSLIPETLAKTTLGVRQVGDGVNLEVDIVAKYVEKLVRP